MITNLLAEIKKSGQPTDKEYWLSYLRSDLITLVENGHIDEVNQVIDEVILGVK